MGESLALKHFDLHVPISEDGRTTFAEVADILDHLATVYAWHPDVHAFFNDCTTDARGLDREYKEEPKKTLKLRARIRKLRGG